MGSGKSQGIIKYMNDNPNNKYIYISPYLEEAYRIKAGCTALNFIEPSDKIEKFNFYKLEHTRYLISNGNNIATTHMAFRRSNEKLTSSIYGIH